ncbi:hypothetical protein DNTS_026675 [Danionella cerebrum]|uniref:Uncharacterized protein n=1 Tax=Danionella cerebrum TaxID=2873325 RepID=A0A553P8X9_9TELE|nr:hypothetical protein DNTS_026675 [Danionella translucida]
MRSNLHALTDIEESTSFLRNSLKLLNCFHKSSPVFAVQICTMVSGKRVADVGYKLVSGSLMLLTVYGAFLCAVRVKQYLEWKHRTLEDSSQISPAEPVK